MRKIIGKKNKVHYVEETTRFQMVKSHKGWLIICASMFALGSGMLVTSRPVSADVAATSTPSSAVNTETTSASSSSATNAETTGASSSSATNAETTGASSSSATKAETASASNSSAANAETASASNSSATNAETTGASSSSAVNADSTGASSGSAVNADSTSANNSSAVNTGSASKNPTVPVTSTDDSVNTGSASKNTTVPATSTDNSANTSSTSENTTVPATSTDNSANTSSTSENTTVPVTSTDDSVNTGSASKNPTVPVTSTDSSVNTGAASKKTSLYATSTDNSKKIKSSLVSNHLEEKDNLENVALSSNSVQPATFISDDTYLKNLGIDINDLNTNSVLKLASLFHIFANQASLSADTNGNLAVKILNGSNDFGTRGDSYNLTSGDIYYIQQLAKDLQSNAFRNKTFNHVVLGKDVNVSIENNKVLINGITMDNLKPEDVYQDTTEQTYIDFSDVFQQLISVSTSYTSTTQTKDVISNYSDMNNRYIDVSGVAAGTQIIYVNVPFEYLSDPQPITIKGISNSLTGPTIVINVTGILDGNQNISTQVQFNYIDRTNALPNSEGHTEPNHVLWNLGTGGQTFNFSSGRFMGSILAPNATINAGVNIDGNIVANIVNITGGESHRWDIHPQPTQPTQPTQTSESQTVNETIHYVYKNGDKAADDYQATPLNFTRTVTTDKVTGEKTYGSWSADQSFAAVTSPAIKGYTPDQAEIGSQTVSGDSSDLDFTVVYAKNAPTITTESKTINETIHYVYKDGTTAHDDYVAKPVEFTREVSTDAVTGEKTYGSWSADQSFAAVTSPELKGYTADKAQIDKQTVNGDSKDLEFKVTYTKTPVAGGNVTAKYVDENGNPIADDVIASGNVGDPYSTTQKDVPGYTFKEVQGNPTGSFTDQDQTVTYVYTKNPATDNNGGTGPNRPGKPGNGTDTGNSSSNQPGNTSQPSNAANNGVINTSTNTGSKVNNSAVNSPELPQTGENNSQSQTMSFIGILLAMFGSLLGFLGVKKRRND
ncbi:mucin-binding protein [Lactococcus lactis]|uniref:mucin-binding protein n=1 Tax=Lactococcus lactis TaxID=1358 RepID=UPI0018AB0CEC|nr:MucBP domain-containing protein [Lactococcus lactis]